MQCAGGTRGNHLLLMRGKMKNSHFRKILLGVCLAAASACSSAAVQNSNSSAYNASNADPAALQTKGAAGVSDVNKDIRKIDFKNFTYEPYCAGEDAMKVTVKNGEFSKETKEADFIDHFYFNVEEPAYGDLNGDNSEEAIVLSVCNTGGTGQFSEGFIYTLKSGKPVLLTRIEGGDRAYGGLRSARVESGFVSVERNDAGEEGGACCPQFYVTTKYKWDGGKLAKSGAETKRELYPAQRVNFAKGSSKTTLKVSVEDIKRYTVGARAGQTLIVSVNTDKVSLSLNKGDADVTEGTNSFTAKLNENGDYEIQLQNIGEKTAEATMTIEIK
jgi:hypothetical protein